jgi:tripartite-type tricarboxylate transporter receptor subunit TctC
LIVPFPPGASYDAIGRIVAEHMRPSLGQPVVVENAGGANGSIGVGRAARAKPDGYTLSLGSISTHVLNGAVYSRQYDLLKDFTPIAPLATAPIILEARKTLPASDLGQLIAWLKANPDTASAATVTVENRLLAAFFQRETGTHFAFVPYRGGAPAVQDLLAGRVDLSFGTPTQLPLLRAGSIRAYAVTSDARLPLAPDVPTFGEMGVPALSYASWYGLFAPRGTPKNIIGKVNAAVVEALADPAVRSRLADFGMGIFPRERQTPEALAALQKADAEKWWPIMKEFGIKAE